MEVPLQSEHGDYATNVAMSSPSPRADHRAVAESIVSFFDLPMARLESRGPGFVNVFSQAGVDGNSS